VTALPESSHLRAVNGPHSESLDGDGLALAYAALERVRSEHGLERLSVTVDDPVLGRQVLVVPRGAPASVTDAEPGWSSQPPIDAPTTDLDLAVALCRVALRVEATGPTERVELELRRLAGVEAVAIEADVIRIQVASSASEGIADDVLGIVKAQLDRTVVVEVTRAASPPAQSREEPSPPAGPVLEVVAVRTAPESGELEVHLRVGEVRTVGRVSLTRGLVGAADATLEAWHAGRDGALQGVAWARTVGTSTDARFVVAVAIAAIESPEVAYGIGTGRNPMEAAVFAAADALPH
jgi:hypothetical protein